MIVGAGRSRTRSPRERAPRRQAPGSRRSSVNVERRPRRAAGSSPSCSAPCALRHGRPASGRCRSWRSRPCRRSSRPPRRRSPSCEGRDGGRDLPVVVDRERRRGDAAEGDARRAGEARCRRCRRCCRRVGPAVRAEPTVTAGIAFARAVVVHEREPAVRVDGARLAVVQRDGHLDAPAPSVWLVRAARRPSRAGRSRRSCVGLVDAERRGAAARRRRPGRCATSGVPFFSKFVPVIVTSVGRRRGADGRAPRAGQRSAACTAGAWLQR